jgi:hypothetical protein
VTLTDLMDPLEQLHPRTAELIQHLWGTPSCANYMSDLFLERGDISNAERETVRILLELHDGLFPAMREIA